MNLLAPLSLVIACLCFPTAVLALPLEPTPAPSNAKVYFVTPTNGAKVQAPFKVQFGLKNMKVVSANINVKGTGHHHLSVDGRRRLNANEPMGNEVIHLDEGQTQIDLFLTPGKHSLQIIFGDYLHRPFEPPIVSEVISITVSSD